MTASVEVRPDHLETTPGETTGITVAVTNGRSVEAQYQVRLVGSDAAWSGEPHLTPVLAPGAQALVELVLTLPLGFPGGDHLLGVEVVPLTSAGTPSDDQRDRRVLDVTVTVGSLSGLHAVMEPRNVVTRQRMKIMTSKASLRSGRAVRRARGGETMIHLRNRSFEPIAVELSASSPADKVGVRFDRTHTVIEPGHVVPVRARIKGKRPLFGQRRRTPFTVTAKGRGNPLHLEGSLQLPARLRPGAIKGIGILAVFALWAGTLAVVFDRVGGDDPDEATAEQATAVVDEGSGAGGSSGESAGGPGGEVESETFLDASGRVTAREPDGVEVRLRAVSLVDELSEGVTFQASMGSSTSADVRLFGRRGGAIFNRIAPAERTTVTDEDGRWGFGEISGPGFFELRFSKPGYATRAYVVEATDDGAPITLDTDLEAGDGSISGVVRGPDGPLGGVDLTITDGTVSLTTSTPTTGNVGSFSVDGLTTPGSYLITASRRGYGTGTQLVRLSGGESATGINLQMQTGVGAITGNVHSPQGPLGDVTVTATDGDIVRTTSTLTEGPVGSFSLPQLPSPGVYTLTIEGDGWMSQTRDVSLTGGQANVGIDMTASTGIVYGRLVDSAGNPIGGAGITAISEDLTYKNTTAPDGTYELVGLEPGSYVIEFDRFEFHPGSALITVGPGSLRQVDLSLSPRDTLEPEPDNSLTVTISAPQITEAVDVTVTDRESGASAVAQVSGSGNAVFNNIPPGVRTLDVTGEGFQETTVQARVALRGANNTSVTLRPLVVVNLLVQDRDASPVRDAQVSIVRSFPACPPVSAAPGCNSPIEATTNEQGRARLPGDAPVQVNDGTYQVTVTHPDFVTESSSFPADYDSNPTENQTISLQRLAQIEFDIVEPRFTAGAWNPRSLTGYQVSLTPALGEPDDHTRIADTNPFVFDRIPYEPGSTTFDATITLDGYNDLVITGISAPPDTVRIHRRVMFAERDATIGQVVWQPRGGDVLPIEGAEVTIEGIVDIARTGSPPTEQLEEFTVFTEPDGTFAFPADGTNGPVFGTAEIEVAHPDFHQLPPLTAQPVGEDLGEIVLEPLPGWLSGEFVFEFGTGFPPTGGVAPNPWSVDIRVLEAPEGIDPADIDIDIDRVVSNFDEIRGFYGESTTIDLEAGTYVLEASYAPQGSDSTIGFTPGQIEVTVQPNRGTDAPDLVLVEQGSISGSIYPTTDPDFVVPPMGGEQAIPGLALTLYDATGDLVDDPDLTITGGTYRFDGLDAGTYTIEAELDGWRQILEPGEITVEVGLNTPDISIVMLELARITGVLEREVDDGVFGAFAGAEVTAIQYGDDDEVVATAVVITDDDEGEEGRFTFANLDGGLRTVIEIRHETFHDVILDTDDDDFDVPDYGETEDLGTIRLLKERATITGFVVSSDGEDAPPDDLTITLRRGSNGSGPSIPLDVFNEETGEFTFTGLFPAEYELEIDAPNHMLDSRPLNPQAGGTINLGTIVLEQRFNTINGSVALRVGSTTLTSGDLGCQEPEADPPTGCTVVSLYRIGPGAGTEPVAQVVTDPNGSFQFADIHDGSYLLQATRDGYVSSGDFPAQPMVLSQGSTRNLGPITLAALTRTVTVTVTSAIDGNLQGVSVQLVPDEDVDDNTAVLATATTNQSGVASFSGVVPGHYVVTADGANAGGRGVLTAEWHLPVAASPSLTIPAMQYQEGRATGSVRVDGTGIESPVGATVEFRSGSATGAVVATAEIVDGDGGFSELLPPGEYVAVATSGDITGDFDDAIGESFEVESGDEVEVEPDPLVVVQRAQITITVVEDSTGDAIEGATINGAPSGTCPSGGCQTNSSGQYVFSLPPGTYTFTVPDGPGYEGDNSAPITVAAGEVGSDTIRLDAYGQVTVTATDAPATNWTVTFTPASGSPVNRNGTGTSGVFTDIPTGTYTVTATSDGENSTGTPTITVARGGEHTVTVTFPAAGNGGD